MAVQRWILWLGKHSLDLPWRLCRQLVFSTFLIKKVCIAGLVPDRTCVSIIWPLFDRPDHLFETLTPSFATITQTFDHVHYQWRHPANFNAWSLISIFSFAAHSAGSIISVSPSKILFETVDIFETSAAHLRTRPHVVDNRLRVIRRAVCVILRVEYFDIDEGLLSPALQKAVTNSLLVCV